MFSRASIIFSLRTFAAALLALYIAFCLDLARPTWAFITVYIVSAPLRGMVRSKGVYRIIGTLAGATFTVAVIPNLVDAPELLVLAIALWIGGCLYLASADGTPRAYAYMLAGYTAAIIGFPSVNAPQTIFDTALSRSEEIGLAILCVELMGYLPFNTRAGDALQAKIAKCLLDARKWAINLMSFSEETIPPAARAQLMIDAVSIDELRIHARYDTRHFPDIETWVIRLQRNIYDFFADLLTLEAQIAVLKKDPERPLLRLQPIIDAFLGWIDSGDIPMPEGLWHLLTRATKDEGMRPLITCGILDTISDMAVRRAECLALREKIVAGVKSEEPPVPVAHHVDHRQSVVYSILTAGMLMIMSAFWIGSNWPDGGTAAFIVTVICCFFSSLEAPPKAAFLFLIMSIIGSCFGWLYNFVVFPHIDGFVMLAYALGVCCVPIGMLMANPMLTRLMLPLVLGINLASIQNRFDANIIVFLNGFAAQTIGVICAGAALSLIRAVTLHGATERLLTENGRALASLALDRQESNIATLDRMAHRTGMAFIRAPGLKEARNEIIGRMLRDLQAGRALVQIKALLPKTPSEFQGPLQAIVTKTAGYFSGRRGLKDAPPMVCDDISGFNRRLDETAKSYDTLRLMGLMKTLSRGLGKEAA